MGYCLYQTIVKSMVTYASSVGWPEMQLSRNYRSEPQKSIVNVQQLRDNALVWFTDTRAKISEFIGNTTSNLNYTI